MEKQLKEDLQIIGEKYAQGLISDLEGQIKDIKKVISMVQSIKLKMDSIDEITRTQVEATMSNLAAMRGFIAEYLRNKNSMLMNIYSFADKKVSLLASNSADREYLEKLNSIQTEIGADQDISLAADKLKSLTSVVETMHNLGGS